MRHQQNQTNIKSKYCKKIQQWHWPLNQLNLIPSKWIIVFVYPRTIQRWIMQHSIWNMRSKWKYSSLKLYNTTDRKVEAPFAHERMQKPDPKWNATTMPTVFQWGLAIRFSRQNKGHTLTMNEANPIMHMNLNAAENGWWSKPVGSNQLQCFECLFVHQCRLNKN